MTSVKILTLSILFMESSMLLLAQAHTCEDFRMCVKFYGVTGDVVCRRDTNSPYDDLNYQWNLLIPQIYPIGYFLPASSAQVRLGVTCAQALHLRVVPKSGGHDYGKHSFGDDNSLVFDLRNMTSFTIDLTSNKVTVGSGFLSGPLAERLHSHDRLLPNGLCATVGISYALGGGYSFLSRRYGLVVDNVLELEMVTAQGQLVTTSEKVNPDLFFALRGAGTGSFGIVTQYTFKIHTIPKNVIYARQNYPKGTFAQVFSAFQSFANGNPPRSTNCVLTVSSTEVTIEIVTLGRNLKKIENLFESNPFPVLGDSKPLVELLAFHDYLTTVGAYGAEGGNIGNVTRKTYAPVYFHGTSFYVSKVIDSQEITEVSRLIDQVPDNISIEFQMHGGAINDLEPCDTAYVHRGNIFYKVNPDYLGPVNSTVGSKLEALVWQRHFFSLTKRVMKHTESYQQNVDPELTDYLERYYASNLPRLIQVKRKFDSKNYFRNPQSIPTTYP